MSIQLASLFQNNAVLQRDKILPVWGWVTPGQRVLVKLAGYTAETLANADGYFRVGLPPLPAGGPHSMEVSLPESGEIQLISNLLIGEVWLASGQSNMQWPLSACGPFAGDLANADLPQVRHFSGNVSMHIGKRVTIGGEWHVTTPDTVGNFSAVAISFARRIYQELQIPVGIIHSSCGGTFLEAWISEQGLSQIPSLHDWLNGYRLGASSTEFWQDYKLLEGLRKPILPADPGNIGEQQGWHLSEHDFQQWETMPLPTIWQAYKQPDSAIYWFRRRVKIPQHWQGQPLVLSLGAIDKQDITYINGVEVGRTGKNFDIQYWDAPRVYPVPSVLSQSAELDIAVRVYSFFGNGGITGPRSSLFIRPFGKFGEEISLEGEWHFKQEQKLKEALFPAVSSTFMGHMQHNSPHLLYDNMIAPLIPYAIRGVIWYQGENNATRATQVPYLDLTRSWVEDWRRAWCQPDLPFIITQLTGFTPAQSHQPESSWARLREQQLLSSEQIDGVGLAVTIDLGDAVDIHPKNKVPIGERLAQYALHHQYGNKDVIPGSPAPKEFVQQGSSILCHFYNLGKGLRSSDGQPLRHFVVAGEDGLFSTAEAVIEGDSVRVSSPAVAAPRYVRYAWANNPDGANLFSAEGLPVSPFRSDSID